MIFLKIWHVTSTTHKPPLYPQVVPLHQSKLDGQISTWTNNKSQANIITQWQSTFGFAYIHTTLLYSCVEILKHCQCHSLHTILTKQLSNSEKEWLPTHWWVLLSQPSHLSFLPQNPDLPPQFLFLALVSPMPLLLAFLWVLTGCQASLDLLTLMVQHLGMLQFPFFYLFSTIMFQHVFSSWNYDLFIFLEKELSM